MMFDFSSYYNLVDAIAYFVASTIPIYFVIKLDKNKQDIKNKRLRNVTILLVVFVLIQGFYHIVSIMGWKIWAKGMMEPLSIIALIFFGFAYLMETIREKNTNKSRI